MRSYYEIHEDYFERVCEVTGTTDVALVARLRDLMMCWYDKEVPKV